MKKMMSIGLVVFIALFLWFNMLGGIRREFAQHLKVKYPELIFKVGYIKLEPIYGMYYAKATCLNDGITFPVSKAFGGKVIYEDYPQYKSGIQYNSKIKGVFEGSDVQGDIRSVTGGGKIPFRKDSAYEQINIYLREESDHIAVVKRVLNILRTKDISAEKIIFTYEKEKGAYELLLSSADYDLTEKELEGKVRKVK